MSPRYALGQGGTDRSTRRLTGVVGARPVEDPDREVRGELDLMGGVSHPTRLLGHPETVIGWGSCTGCGRAAHLVELLAEAEVEHPRDGPLLVVEWCLSCLVWDMGWWPQAAWPPQHPQYRRGWQGVERPIGRQVIDVP